MFEFPSGYVLVVRYLDCTNFEGVKVMVYKGKFPGREKIRRLDPHFDESKTSPIARFKPNAAGLAMAKELAGKLR